MSDEYVVIPPDRLEDDQLNVENRLHIISKINACETKKEELDTSVIDQLLGLFHGSNVFIFATMCTPLCLHCGLLWSIVVHCGPLWSIVVHCGPLWSIVGFSQTVIYTFYMLINVFSFDEKSLPICVNYIIFIHTVL